MLVASALIEWTLRNLVLSLPLLLRPRDVPPVCLKKLRTSSLSELLRTFNFWLVFANLLIIRFSMLLRLLMTFSWIWVVSNSLITLLTCSFFLYKSCCYKAKNLAWIAWFLCFFIEEVRSFLALCSLDRWLRISRSFSLRSRFISKWLSFLLSIIDCLTIERLTRLPSFVLKLSNFCFVKLLFRICAYRIISFFSRSR